MKYFISLRDGDWVDVYEIAAVTSGSGSVNTVWLKSGARIDTLMGVKEIMKSVTEALADV